MSLAVIATLVIFSAFYCVLTVRFLAFADKNRARMQMRNGTASADTIAQACGESADFFADAIDRGISTRMLCEWERAFGPGSLRVATRARLSNKEMTDALSSGIHPDAAELACRAARSLTSSRVPAELS